MNKRKIILPVLLIAFWFAANGQSEPRLEQQVISLSNKKFNWLIEKKYDSLNMVLDDRLAYVHSNGWIQTKKDVIDDMKSGKLNYVKVTVREVSARVYNKAAIVNGSGTFEGILEGKPFTLELRYTEVYVKSGKTWKLASRHSNRLP